MLGYRVWGSQKSNVIIIILFIIIFFFFFKNGEQGVIGLKKNPHKTLFKAESILAVRL